MEDKFEIKIDCSCDFKGTLADAIVGELKPIPPKGGTPLLCPKCGKKLFKK